MCFQLKKWTRWGGSPNLGQELGWIIELDDSNFNIPSNFEMVLVMWHRGGAQH